MRKSRMRLVLTAFAISTFCPVLVLGTENKDVTVNDLKEVSAIADNLVGIWKYKVTSAPPEYSTGVIVINNKEGDYAVEVQLAAGSLKGSNVSVEGNNISFEITLEGTVFTVQLTAEGDTITGESSSYEGTYQITGSRIKPE